MPLRITRMVEPGMPLPLVPPQVAAATVKSAGSIVSAAIGRYRPAGVPRTGSPEDRAAAYQRFMDAATNTMAHTYLFRHMQREGGRGADKVLIGQIPQVWEAGSELICALNSVRLRGTISVIAAAEALGHAVANLEMNDPDEAHFAAMNTAAVAAHSAFLDAARTDLGYTTRPWQILRRIRERKFLRAQAAPAIEA